MRYYGCHSRADYIQLNEGIRVNGEVQMPNDYHIFFSSESNEWATPQSLFDELDKEFHFTLDPCCTHENAKCKRHFTIEEDGLRQNWGGGNQYSVIRLTEKVFINGLRKRGRNPQSLIPLWSCSYRHGQIHDTFTITSCTGARSVSLKTV